MDGRASRARSAGVLVASILCFVLSILNFVRRSWRTLQSSKNKVQKLKVLLATLDDAVLRSTNVYWSDTCTAGAVFTASIQACIRLVASRLCPSPACAAHQIQAFRIRRTMLEKLVERHARRLQTAPARCTSPRPHARSRAARCVGIARDDVLEVLNRVGVSFLLARMRPSWNSRRPRRRHL